MSTNDEITKLRTVITEMDALSQEGFSEISAIAELALAALETPDGYSKIENIVQALQVIRKRAMDIENCVNATAEAVGCNYEDEALKRRYAAHRAVAFDVAAAATALAESRAV